MVDRDIVWSYMTTSHLPSNQWTKTLPIVLTIKTSYLSKTCFMYFLLNTAIQKLKNILSRGMIWIGVHVSFESVVHFVPLNVSVTQDVILVYRNF